MSNTREIEAVMPLDDNLARARLLHVAEGILVCLHGCTPEEAFAEMVAVARSAGRPTLTDARELIDVAVHASERVVLEDHWSQLRCQSQV